MGSMAMVAGQSAFQIRVQPGDDARQMTVTITADECWEWTYKLPGWRPLAAGWGCGQAYLWSARDLVILPGAPGEDPRGLAIDEDLLLVFRIEDGWVLVCETSVRLVTGPEEVSRLEFGEVIDRARWTPDGLQIHDVEGAATIVTVAGGQLVAGAGAEAGRPARAREGDRR